MIPYVPEFRRRPSDGSAEILKPPDINPSSVFLNEDSLMHLFVFLLSFGRFLFLLGFLRRFLSILFAVLTFGHDDCPFKVC